MPCEKLKKFIAEGHNPDRLDNLKAWRNEALTARLEITPATPADAREFAYVQCEGWRHGYGDILTPDQMERNTNVENRASFLRELIADNPGSYFIARDGDKACGICAVGESRDVDLPHYGELGAIYVLKEYTGRGVGAELIRVAEDRLRELGYKKAFLWVFEQNPRARRFYEKHGWSFDGAQKDCGFKSVEIRYRKQL